MCSIVKNEIFKDPPFYFMKCNETINCNDMNNVCLQYMYTMTSPFHSVLFLYLLLYHIYFIINMKAYRCNKTINSVALNYVS